MKNINLLIALTVITFLSLVTTNSYAQSDVAAKKCKILKYNLMSWDLDVSLGIALTRIVHSNQECWNLALQMTEEDPKLSWDDSSDIYDEDSFHIYFYWYIEGEKLNLKSQNWGYLNKHGPTNFLPGNQIYDKNGIFLNY